MQSGLTQADHRFNSNTTAAASLTADQPLIDLVTQIANETTDLLRAAESDVRNYVDGVIGSAPVAISKENAANARPPASTRGASLESSVRTVRELVFEVRNQINRLTSI